MQAYNEGLRVYLYDDALLRVWKARGDGSRLSGRGKAGREVAGGFAPGELLAYDLRQDGAICVDVAVRGPLSGEERERMGLLEPLLGLLSLPTGALCVECANDFRLDAEDDGAGEDGGTLIQVPPDKYLVRVYHVDMESLPADEQYDYEGPFQVVTLEPAGATDVPPAKRGYLAYPRRRTAGAKKKVDTSWVGKYSVDDSGFEGVFVHNYDVSGPCINFDRDVAYVLGLALGSRVVVEFESARIEALFVGNAHADERDPAADVFAEIRGQTKCGFVTDREGIEKLMLFEFPDRDMMHFDFRKKPLFGTAVRIRRLD